MQVPAAAPALFPAAAALCAAAGADAAPLPPGAEPPVAYAARRRLEAPLRGPAFAVFVFYSSAGLNTWKAERQEC